jgi:hypothetical protein
VDGGSAAGGDHAEVAGVGSARGGNGAGGCGDRLGCDIGSGSGGNGAVGYCGDSAQERGEGEYVLHFCERLGLSWLTSVLSTKV